MFTKHFGADGYGYACEGDTITCEVDGFEVVARIAHDSGHGIDDDDSHNVDQKVTGCNDEQQAALLGARAAFKRNEWFYCGIVLSVSRNGVTLDEHAASLWGIECNYPAPANSNAHLLEVANELLPEALDTARKELAKLGATPKIRFVLETVTSAFDRNGNRETFAIATSTMTGKRVAWHAYGPGNARSDLYTATGAINHPTVLTVESVDVPCRQWAAMAKDAGATYSHEATDKLKTLETE